MRRLSLVAALLASCSPSAGGTPRDALSDAAYCEAAADPRARLAAGVVTLCEQERGEHDEGAPAGCAHRRLADDGALAPLGIDGATDVLAGPDGALVIRFADGRLVLRRGAEDTELARWAADPAIAGDRLAYVAAPADALLEEGEPTPGTPLEVILRPFGGSPEVLAIDDTASDPFPLPDGSGLLLTSTRTGLASLYLARPGVPLAQLTNVGLETTGQAFVPVPHRELVWVPGTLTAIYTARFDDDRVWRLDVATGEAREIGPGRMPLLDGDAVRLATPAEDCARRVPFGGGA